VTGIDMIVFQEFDNRLTHTVITRLTDKGCVQPNSTQRDETIEHRTTRHSPNGCVILENDVENRLANTNYFSHNHLVIGAKLLKIIQFITKTPKIIVTLQQK
jgi:hypothetical protein